MHYSEVIQYLYAQLPMFTRIGSRAYKADLSNIIAFCELIGNPQNQFKSIHVGGTNGKGSSSHMLAAVLQSAGYKTGLYTSPHLRDFRERIRINGVMISEERVVQFVTRYQTAIDSIRPSFFEMTVAMAFDYFATEQVDIAIIEVGLGGRLDSTNIIHPLLAIITNISFDHVDILGGTLAEIASEKAGIIKAKRPIIIGEKQNEIVDVFLQKAKQMDAKITFADEAYRVRQATVDRSEFLNLSYTRLNSASTNTIQLDLTGTYQLKNLSTVLCAIDELKNLDFIITDACIQSALKEVCKLTGLMGRWQILQKDPLVICDTGHNESGISEVMKNIQATPHAQLHMVIGMLKDKDVNTILNLFPRDAHYYFCQPNLPRAKLAQELALEAQAADLHGQIFDTVNEALEAAKNQAQAADLIFVGGSTFVVAEVV